MFGTCDGNPEDDVLYGTADFDGHRAAGAVAELPPRVGRGEHVASDQEVLIAVRTGGRVLNRLALGWHSLRGVEAAACGQPLLPARVANDEAAGRLVSAVAGPLRDLVREPRQPRQSPSRPTHGERDRAAIEAQLHTDPNGSERTGPENDL